VSSDIEVFIDFAPGLKRVGTLRSQDRRGGEAVNFEYYSTWLHDAARFSLEPALKLGHGVFAPASASAGTQNVPPVGS
jgi:serine/threonine-protein kinase HipA